MKRFLSLILALTLLTGNLPVHLLADESTETLKAEMTDHPSEFMEETVSETAEETAEKSAAETEEETAGESVPETVTDTAEETAGKSNPETVPPATEEAAEEGITEPAETLMQDPTEEITAEISEELTEPMEAAAAESDIKVLELFTDKSLVIGSGKLKIYTKFDCGSSHIRNVDIFYACTEIGANYWREYDLPMGTNSLSEQWYCEIDTEPRIKNVEYRVKKLQVTTEDHQIVTFVNPILAQDGEKLLPSDLTFKILPEDSSGDMTRPVLKWITADHTSMEAPGSIKIQAEIYDNLDPAPDVQLTFLRTGKPDNHQKNIHLYYREESGLYENTMEFGEFADQDEYYLAYVHLRDHSSNNAWYVSERKNTGRNGFLLPNEVVFDIYNDKADTQAPVLRDMSVNFLELREPGTFKTEFIIEETGSGIDKAEISLYFHRPDPKKCVVAGWTLSDSNGDGNLDYKYDFTEYSENTDIYIKSLRIWDKAGNFSEYYASGENMPDKMKLPMDVKFSFVNPNPEKVDTEGPVLKELTVLKKEITAPDYDTFFVKAEDHVSGIKYCEIFLRKTGSDEEIRWKMEYNAAIDAYQFHYFAQEWDPREQLYVYGIFMEDNAGNGSAYWSKHQNQHRAGETLKEEVVVEIYPAPGDAQYGQWLQQNGKWWYRHEDGSCTRNDFERIGGNRYYFDENGYMVTGWIQVKEEWYYFDDNGHGHIGWLTEGDKVYCFGDDCKMIRYFRELDGHWYYFGEDGARVSGWVQGGENWYYFGEDGIMLTDTWVGECYVGQYGSWDRTKFKEKWIDYEGKRWYRHADGGCTRNDWEAIDGNWYRFDYSGWLITGWWQNQYGIWYYLEEDGLMSLDWKQLDGSWYYFDEAGHMLTGWQTIDGNLRYMLPNGKRAEETWIEDDGKHYYFDADGFLQTNTWIGEYYVDDQGAWVQGVYQEKWIEYEGKRWYRHMDGSCTRNDWEAIDGHWYRFDYSGWMVTGWWQNSYGIWFYFDDAGHMLYGWQTLGGNRFYFDEAGHMLTDWNTLDGFWYFFDGAGHMLCGWQTLGGNTFYLGEDGRMRTGWQSVAGKTYFFDEAGHLTA